MFLVCLLFISSRKEKKNKNIYQIVLLYFLSWYAHDANGNFMTIYIFSCFLTLEKCFSFTFCFSYFWIIRFYYKYIPCFTILQVRKALITLDKHLSLCSYMSNILWLTVNLWLHAPATVSNVTKSFLMGI